MEATITEFIIQKHFAPRAVQRLKTFKEKLNVNLLIVDGQLHSARDLPGMP